MRIEEAFEKSMKAPKGRNVIAWGSAPGTEGEYSLSPEGAKYYVALTGLAMVIMLRVLGRCPRLLHCAPLGLFKQLLRMRTTVFQSAFRNRQVY
jgi:hypothetical protein